MSRDAITWQVWSWVSIFKFFVPSALVSLILQVVSTSWFFKLSIRTICCHARLAKYDSRYANLVFRVIVVVSLFLYLLNTRDTPLSLTISKSFLHLPWWCTVYTWPVQFLLRPSSYLTQGSWGAADSVMIYKRVQKNMGFLCETLML